MKEFNKYKKNYLKPFNKDRIEDMRKTISINSILSDSSSNDEDNLCCICFENLLDKNIVTLTNCEHQFHIECIRKWLFDSNICPLCKSDQRKLKKRFFKNT